MLQQSLQRIKTLSIVGLSLLIGNGLNAHDFKPAHTGELTKDHKVSFIENKGQWINDAKYKADLPGGVVFLTDQGFVYNFANSKDLLQIQENAEGGKSTDLPVRYHSYKVNFEGANTNIKYINSEKRKNYQNYFIGNDKSKWAGKVGLFGKVEQQNIYNGIDLAVYSNDKNAVKYDFIVAPNANPNQIILSFDGVTPQIKSDGSLFIKTTVNEISESAPYTYQIINDKEVLVKSAYKLKNGKVSFTFPDGYNSAYPLIIDPTLVFATFSGGTTGTYYAYSTTYDLDGNMYASGLGDGTGWPVTTGAFQLTGIGSSVVINKYNSLGSQLVYSTYYGGSGGDVPNSLRVNDLNELVVVGATSSSNLPTTTGAYDITLGGSSDIYVAHFNDLGTALIGATYVGGAAIEPYLQDISTSSSQGTSLSSSNYYTSPCEVNFDAAGNIWVVSSTGSTDFPVTADAIQSTNGGGYDGVFFKLDPTCSNLLYSSYLGGTSDDIIYTFEFNSEGNLLLGGGTRSTNFPTTSAALNTTYLGGNWDGFVAKFNVTTSTLEYSTFIGTDNLDNVTKIQIDQADNIYILGRTLGNYPITTGVWAVPNGDVFIAKLSPTLSTSLLSTRVGKNQGSASNSFIPTAFLLDNCENVYVAGLNATSGMPITPDAFDANQKPFWFCAIKPNFEDILFGTYFGTSSDHCHAGISRFDPEGIVYHSVCATSTSYPTTPGSWSPIKQNGGTNDVVSFKFNFDANGVRSHVSLPTTTNDTGCAPYTIHFNNTSTSPYSIQYDWSFGDGGTSVLPTPTYTFANPGVYDVILHANSDSACITDDWDTLRIVVLHTELPQITTSDTVICGDVQSLDLKVDIENPSPNNSILWTPNNGILSGSTQDIVTVNPSVNQIYYVTVKDTIPGICGFSVTDTVHIDYAPRELNIITNDTVVCEGAQIPIVAVGSPDFDFKWSPPNGVNNINALNPIITINQPMTYTLTASHTGCPDTSQTITFQMHEIPKIDLGIDKEVCEWDVVTLESLVTPFRNDYTYNWSPTSGLISPNLPNTQFNADTSITYKLNVSTPIGCSSSDSVNIIVNPGNFGSIVADTGFCPPSTIQLWAEGGVSYQWSPAYGLDNAEIAKPTANPATTTDYSVVITDIHGCLDTQTINVQVFPLAVLQIPDEVTIFPGEEYQINPYTNASYFKWFPPSGVSNTDISDPVLNPEVRTRYFVTATTENGCSLVDSIDVLVDGTVIDMPNAFTPGNGTSNVFKASKRGMAELKEFAIFNRWGNKVFSTTNIEEGWDGTYKGKAQPLGTYIYIIDAVTNDGKPFKKEGNVTLIR